MIDIQNSNENILKNIVFYQPKGMIGRVMKKFYKLPEWLEEFGQQYGINSLSYLQKCVGGAEVKGKNKDDSTWTYNCSLPDGWETLVLKGSGRGIRMIYRAGTITDEQRAKIEAGEISGEELLLLMHSPTIGRASKVKEKAPSITDEQLLALPQSTRLSITQRNRRTELRKKKATEMVKDGHSLVSIAEVLGIAEPSVSRLVGGKKNVKSKASKGTAQSTASRSKTSSVKVKKSAR